MNSFINTLVELLKLMLGTNNQVIMKLDPSGSGPAVELISLGPIGTDNKMAGVRTWHRVPSFKNLEWSEVKINNKYDENGISWMEIGDARRLVKIIGSIIGISTSMTDDYDVPNISVRINETEMTLSSSETPCSFSLPIRWFDSKWASATISFPNSSPPRACVKLVSGLDQLAVILKRADRWRSEEWAIDILSVSVKESESNRDLWDIHFLAETSSPPMVRLETILSDCPISQITSIKSCEECKVSVNLGAATKALFIPLAENEFLVNASSGVTLLWIPEEALIGNINWNAVGLGLISSTIFIPARLN